MTKEQEALLAEIDRLSGSAIEAFSAAIPAAEQAILEQVLEAIAEMRRKSTDVVASVENLRFVNRLRQGMNGIVGSTGYSKALRQFMQAFTASGNLLNQYFASLNVGFQADKALYGAIQRANVTTTINSLLGTGMQANFIDPVINLLEKNIAGGSSYKALRAVLAQEISGNGTIEGRLTRYTGQVADDALHQYQRNYLEAISSDLGLAHYLYAGTPIRTTRPFCRTRVGSYYTLKEVQSWGGQEWAGRIPGTNSQNIRTYLGGYRCGHRLMPVSQEIYAAAMAK